MFNRLLYLPYLPKRFWWPLSEIFISAFVVFVTFADFTQASSATTCRPLLHQRSVQQTSVSNENSHTESVYTKDLIDIFQTDRNRTQWETLRARMTFEQFKTLMHSKMVETGVFDYAFFAHGGVFEATDPHAFGGAVRGLILWILERAQTKTYPQILSTPPPTYENLARLAGGADYDFVLYGSNSGKSLIALKSNLKLYDVFYPDFYEGSIAAGGSAVDKVAIGRNRILDPYGALETIFNSGQLRFIVREGALFKHIEFEDNHRFALLLKHFRVLSSLRLTLTGQDLQEIRSFVEVQRRSGIPKKNFFIQKALEKLPKGRVMRKLFAATGLDRALLEAEYELNLTFVDSNLAARFPLYSVFLQDPQPRIESLILRREYDTVHRLLEIDDQNLRSVILEEVGSVAHPDAEHVRFIKDMIVNADSTSAPGIAGQILATMDISNNFDLIDAFIQTHGDSKNAIFSLARYVLQPQYSPRLNRVIERLLSTHLEWVSSSFLPLYLSSANRQNLGIYFLPLIMNPRNYDLQSSFITGLMSHPEPLTYLSEVRQLLLSAHPSVLPYFKFVAKNFERWEPLILNAALIPDSHQRREYLEREFIIR